MAFLAIRHKDFYFQPEKLVQLKVMLAVAAYHLNAGSMLPKCQMTATRQFAVEFFKGYINRLNVGAIASFPTVFWNWISVMVSEEALEEDKAMSNKMVKWAAHLTNKKGFVLQVAMLQANDAMRKGSVEKAYEYVSGML